MSYKIPRLADAQLDGEVTFGFVLLSIELLIGHSSNIFTNDRGLDESKFDPATLVTLDNVSPDGFWEADMDGSCLFSQL